MNLPTKITVSRIIATAVIFVALLTLYFVKIANPSFVTPFLQLGNVQIDYIFIGLLVVFILVQARRWRASRLRRRPCLYQVRTPVHSTREGRAPARPNLVRR